MPPSPVVNKGNYLNYMKSAKKLVQKVANGLVLQIAIIFPDFMVLCESFDTTGSRRNTCWNHAHCFKKRKIAKVLNHKYMYEKAPYLHFGTLSVGSHRWWGERGQFESLYSWILSLCQLCLMKNVRLLSLRICIFQAIIYISWTVIYLYIKYIQKPLVPKFWYNACLISRPLNGPRWSQISNIL